MSDNRQSLADLGATLNQAGRCRSGADRRCR